MASQAGLDIAAAALAADALVSADFLADERPLRFVHLLLRAAVYDDLPRGRRGLEHARAAKLLHDPGAEAEEIAGHVLLAEPGSSQMLHWLREAARSALARGAPGGVAAYLRHAAREATTADLRAELLHELGAAEVVGRDPRAVRDLREALALSSDPPRRARIAAELAEILILAHQWDAAMELFRTALSEVDEHDAEMQAHLLALRVWARMIGAGVGGDSEADERLVRALSRRATVNGRALSLVLALTSATRLEDLDQVVGLVEHAIESDDLLELEGSAGWVLPNGVAALVLIDQLDRAQALVERMLDAAQHHNSVLGFASATLHRAWISVRRGDLAAAEDDLRGGLALANEHGLSVIVLAALHYGLEALTALRMKRSERRVCAAIPPHPRPCLRSMAREKRRPKKSGRGDKRSTDGQRVKDPGPPYVVMWHPGADAERDSSWPAAEKVAMFHAAQKLEAAGPRLGHPHSSAVQGDVGQGFRELRPRAGRSRGRPIYRRVSPSTFVILAVGPEAGIDSRDFDAAVARAVERFGQLELD